MAASYLRASMSLQNYADELFEEIYVGHGEINPADWLGIPIAGRFAHIEFVEDFNIPAEVDQDLAGAPADSEATFPATEEEAQMMLHPQVIGNPTNMESNDDDLLRENPR
eukprot:8297847-Pyramimonas_sp.AAC.1